MNKVQVITAFVPLPSSGRTDFAALGKKLKETIPTIRVFDNFPIQDCWAYKYRHWPPATSVPADRFNSPAEMALSNVILHQRTSWAMQAYMDDPSIDVVVWIDYGIFKQGGWTGRPVLPEHIASFVKRLEEQPIEGIPFPAIWGKGPISDTEIDWRFCGSTLILPTKYLPQIHAEYGHELNNFIQRRDTIPHDTPIWAYVERNSGLPFIGYSANHDATQFTNYRGQRDLTPLCNLAIKHQTDKGPHHDYTSVYWDYLQGRRESVERVLEIGIGYASKGHAVFWPPGASLRMWEEFFPNAQIFGMDIAPEVLVNEGRIKSSLVDQSNAISLYDGIKRIGGKFDLIVDDGSHELLHQVLTAHIYLPFLAEGGIFVIEDVNQDPTEIIRRLPEGYAVDAFRSHAEPAHAYILVIQKA